MTALITTERLLLRPHRAEDGDAVVALLNNLDVTRWLAKVPHPFTHADLRIVNTDGSSRWPNLVAITWDGALIGGISGGHLGYWLGQDYWGQGFGYEAARAMRDYQFDVVGVDALVSGYFEGNTASQRILTKLGFVETDRNMLFNTALDRKAPNVDMELARATWEARQ